MCTRAELSAGIALWLADTWKLYRSTRFLGYVTATYGMHVEPAPFFECVWIAEAEDGDLDAGAIGGIISRWWVMDDAGLSGEVCPLKLRFADDSTLFDTQPVLKFFMSGDGVVLGEWFGPRLICRKVGRVVVSDAVVSVIDLRVTWVAQV